MDEQQFFTVIITESKIRSIWADVVERADESLNDQSYPNSVVDTKKWRDSVGLITTAT